MSNITNCGNNKKDTFDIDTIEGIYGFLAETFKQNGFSSLEFSLLEKLKSQCKKDDEMIVKKEKIDSIITITGGTCSRLEIIKELIDLKRGY